MTFRFPWYVVLFSFSLPNLISLARLFSQLIMKTITFTLFQHSLLKYLLQAGLVVEAKLPRPFQSILQIKLHTMQANFHALFVYIRLLPLNISSSSDQFSHL